MYFLSAKRHQGRPEGDRVLGDKVKGEMDEKIGIGERDK
jgi:hypothetical protein